MWDTAVFYIMLSIASMFVFLDIAVISITCYPTVFNFTDRNNHLVQHNVTNQIALFLSMHGFLLCTTKKCYTVYWIRIISIMILEM